jgi:hypothetical protein
MKNDNMMKGRNKMGRREEGGRAVSKGPLGAG